MPRIDQFKMEHDFEKFPELSNADLNLFYFQSPHKQILDDIVVDVTKVTDGDTIKVKWAERDFEFPVRILDIDAPELNEPGGLESKAWLTGKILNKEVDLRISRRNRVGKWGRLLARVEVNGMNIGQESIMFGFSEPFGSNQDWKIPETYKWR